MRDKSLNPLRPLTWGSFLFLALIVNFSAQVVRSQEPEDAAEKIPEPEDVELTTPDGLEMNVRYFPGLHGKDTVPVMIIHHWDGQGSDYYELAATLQSKGHAVVVPDLRGHGGSRQFANSSSNSKPLSPDRFKTPDLVKIVRLDLETVKRFLLEKNNAGELNVDKLCVVGVEVGSLLALNWAVEDWNWPDLATMKQGKDVKAMVLISPETAFRGIVSQRALDHVDVRRRLSMLIVVGGKEKNALRYAERLHGQLKKYHPDPPAGQEKELQSLFFVKHDTNLQGFKLMEQEDFRVDRLIAGFIQARLGKSKKIPWTDRSR